MASEYIKNGKTFVSFSTAEEKKAFFDYCYQHNLIPARVMSVLAKKFMDGKIKL